MATLTTTVSTDLPAWDCLYGTNTNFSTTSGTYVTETQLGSMAGMPANTRIGWNLTPYKSSSTAAGDGAKVCDSTGTYTYGSITEANFTTGVGYWINATWKGEHGNNGTVTIEMQLKSGNGTAINTQKASSYNTIYYAAQNPNDSEHIHPRILQVGGKTNKGTQATTDYQMRIPIKYNITEIQYAYINASYYGYAGTDYGITVHGGGYQCSWADNSPSNTAGWRVNDGVRGNITKAVSFRPENVLTDGITCIFKYNTNTWNTGSGGQYGHDAQFNFGLIAFSGTQVELT